MPLPALLLAQSLVASLCHGFWSGQYDTNLQITNIPDPTHRVVARNDRLSNSIVLFYRRWRPDQVGVGAGGGARLAFRAPPRNCGLKRAAMSALTTSDRYSNRGLHFTERSCSFAVVAKMATCARLSAGQEPIQAIRRLQALAYPAKPSKIVI